jgi:hypothetical protein
MCSSPVLSQADHKRESSQLFTISRTYSIFALPEKFDLLQNEMVTQETLLEYRSTTVSMKSAFASAPRHLLLSGARNKLSGKCACCLLQ